MQLTSIGRASATAVSGAVAGPSPGMSDGDRRSPLRLLCVGGEDHHLRLPFLRGLRPFGIEVHAAASCDGAAFAASGIPFRRYAFSRSLDPVGDWKAAKALRDIVDAVQPQVVQSFDTKPNLHLVLIGAALADVRLVRTINGTGRIHASSRLSARCLRPLYNLVQRRAARIGATTVFQNEADRALFEARGMARPAAARLIRGSGIDVEAFDRARDRRAETQASEATSLRQELGLTGSRIVMTVTRIEPLKGIRTLLAAAELVRRVLPDTQFVLVGPWDDAGGNDRGLRDLCRRSTGLRWIGPHSDIPGLLQLADVFVLPTEFREGLPRVLLEAALAGLPIVTTDMPGCRSVVREGLDGLIVPLRSPGALAASILDLLAAPARASAMGTSGAERVRREFSLAEITQQYAALYQALVHGGTAPLPA